MATTAWADPSPPRRPATDHYTRLAIALHWLIAAAILYNLASGLLRPVLPRGFFVFHVSSGLTILILSVFRVGWRLLHKPPPFLPMKRWESRLAHGVHVALYAAMLVLPFSGWALISSSPPAGSPGAALVTAERAAALPVGTPVPAPRKPAMFWNLVPVPLIAPINEMGRMPTGVAGQRTLHDRLESLHGLGGWIMLFLLVLHIGGALKHQFIDRMPELARMGVGRRERKHPETFGG